MKSQLVVITDDEDAHLPYVQKHLDEPLHILDPQDLLAGTSLSYQLQRHKMVVTYGDKRLDRVIGVWYRRPRFIDRTQVPVAQDYKDYASSAIHTLTAQLHTAFRGALWVSDYYAMLRARNKAWQLELAAQTGFNVPATLMTSDTKAAEAFINKHQRVIVKPLATTMPVIGGVPKTFFSTIVTANNKPDLTNLHLAPAIFQQLITADHDVRVTVIGNELFAAKLHNQDSLTKTGVRDWRSGQLEGKLDIEACTLPSEVKKQCFALIKALGLNFGSMDLVMDTKGKLWFLENNANGQWGFIEDATAQPIGKAMAALLTSKALS